MDPEKYLRQYETARLMRVVSWFANEYLDAGVRRDFLALCEIDNSFLNGLNCAKSPAMFATALAAAFKKFQVSEKKPEYHPMPFFLSGIADLPRPSALDDADLAFSEAIVARARENARALKARSAVCRIESPPEHPLGTGVYLSGGMLLTCGHVLSAAGDRKAYARFGYSREDRKWGDYKLFEIQTPAKCIDKKKDFALSTLKDEPTKGEPTEFPAQILDGIPGSGPEAFVRLVHHFQGGPAVVSEGGVVVQRDEDFLYHTVGPVEKMSSGAPLFNRDWKVVGIHRGDGALSIDGPQGASVAVPVDVFAGPLHSERRNRDDF